MFEKLNLPESWNGNLWHYRFQNWKHTMHQHVELEFNLITQGSGIYLSGQDKYHVRRGDLIWLYPKQQHLLVQETPDFEMWIAVLKPETLARIATDANQQPLRRDESNGGCCRRLTQRQLQRMDTLLGEILPTKDQPAHFNAGLGYGFLTSWKYFEKADAIPVEDVHPAVEKVARIIHHSDDTASLSELAYQAGLSPARLSRLFKQQTGVTMVDFRNRIRLGRFFNLYGTGQRHTMLHAALEAGFGSYPQFHRVFKRELGCSPRSHPWGS